jgi:AraC-like DNA-binding protein
MYLNLKKVSGLRSQIIKTVMVLLVILGAANSLIYNVFGELYSIRALKESAGLACAQLGTSCETTLYTLAERVSRIAFFDFADFNAVAEPGKTYEFLTSVDRELLSIVTLNAHIHSAYIYLAEQGRIFDSRRIPSMVTSLENFPDREIFSAAGSRSIRLTSPRLLTDPIPERGPYTVITFISPLVIRNGGNAWLAVNINVDTLYSSLAKNIYLAGGFTSYAYNADNTVILHSSDKNRLYAPLDPETLPVQASDLFHYFHRERPITSVYTSAWLNWTFVVETPVKSVVQDLQNYIAVNLLIIFTILVIISLVVFIKTAPVSRAAAAMSEVLWKEALLDRVARDDEITQQLSGTDFAVDPDGALYGGICVAGAGGSGAGLLKPVCEKIDPALLAGKNGAFKLIQVSKNAVALVLKYRTGNPDIHRNAARRILEAFSPPEDQRTISIALSGLQKNFALLPLCYQQCEDALKYKICLESPVLDHSLISELDRDYEFPAELAQQLHNNIAAGSKSGCAVCLDKIFGPLGKKRVIISDEKIINLVVFLQNGAFKTISGLPIPVKIDAENLKDLSLSGMKASLLSFCEKICDEINSLKENQKQGLFTTVMAHIEKNCLTDHLISVTSVADDFQISKNQVRGIVKYATGMDFPEFINKKRIEYAKELLLNKNITVEEIAKAAGYNYSYYFIKIFKSLEGVTPGQYRAGRTMPASAPDAP